MLLIRAEPFITISDQDSVTIQMTAIKQYFHMILIMPLVSGGGGGGSNF